MEINSARPYSSTGEIAEFLGTQAWRVGRIFELGIVPEPARVAGRRAIPAALVPEIVDALRDRNWLPSDQSEDDR